MTRHILVGTYTDDTLAHVNGKAAGILSADYADGRVGRPEVAGPITNPSWLTVSPDGRSLYAVIESKEFQGLPGGGVAAYARDPESGQLTLLNEKPSAGVEPAHVAIDPSGRFVLVANYRTGSVAVFAHDADGSLGAMVGHVQHDGSSVHPIRQTGPHAHQIVFDPKTGRVLVPDLGLDALLFYDLDESGRLTERRDLRFSTVPGAGPRHLAFHPDGDHLFLMNELDNTLLVLRRDAGRDGFAQTDVKSTLPGDFGGHNQTSEVRVSADGSLVFGSNRGHNSIAVFRFDPASSSVELRHLEPTRGDEPRDFVTSPDGGYLLVANQNTDTIVTFAVDPSGPSLEYVSTSAAQTPVCLVFV